MSSSANSSPVTIGTSGMTLDDVIAVARDGHQVSLSDEAVSAMAATRVQIEALAHAAEPVYGVSTGFGALANRHIPAEMRTQLQRSLIRSHAAGMGEPVERDLIDDQGEITDVVVDHCGWSRSSSRRPASRAWRTIDARELARSLVMMCARWLSTVRTLTTSISAISWFV